MNGEGPSGAVSTVEPVTKANGSPGIAAVRERGNGNNHGTAVESGADSGRSSSGGGIIPILKDTSSLGNGDGDAAAHATEEGGENTAVGALLHAAGQNASKDSAIDITEEAGAQPLRPPTDHGWRVKLYQLKHDGQWDDRGTGHVICRLVEAFGGLALVMTSEDPDVGELLCSRVSFDDIYMRQGDNIITWCEPRASAGGTASAIAGLDLALSFQENEGCIEVWSRICDVQGISGGGSSGGGSGEGGGGRELALPEAQLDNLQAIAEALTSLSPAGKGAATLQVLADGGAYVRRLLAVFSDAEGLEDADGLRTLCRVMKHIVALNDQHVLELLLSDRLFAEVAGVFEYDPELRRPAKHRDFLAKMARFRQVLPIENADVVARIHQNFRITFLKDMLLRPMLDEAIGFTLGNMTFINSTEIFTALGADGDYAKRVFLLLEQPGLPRERRAEGLAFLKELFAMARTVQLTAREQVYRHLWTQAPLFSVFVPVLRDPSAAVAERSACMDVLLSALAHDPGLLRQHTIKRGSHPPPPHAAGAAGGGCSSSGGAGRIGNGSSSNAGAASGRGALLAAGVASSGGACADGAGKVARSVRECESVLFWLLRRLATDSDLGVLVQAMEVIKLLLDTDSMETQSDRDSFLGPFYDHYVYWLAEPLGDMDSPSPAASSLTSSSQLPVLASESAGATAAAATAAAAAGDEPDVTKASKGHACELLSFCVRAHTYRMKYFVLRNGVAMRVLKLLRYRDKFLQLAAVRFLRSCVGMKDEFYNRYIAKNNLLAPLVTILRESGDRDNLLTSAIIELIEYVRAENIRSLIDYLCERRLEPPTGTSLGAVTFAGLRRRYEQNHDSDERKSREGGLATGGDGGVGGSNAAGGGPAAAGDNGAGGRWAGSRAMYGRRRLLEEEEDEAYFDGPDDEEAGPSAPEPSLATAAADDGGGLLGGMAPLRCLGADDAAEGPAGSWPLGRQLPSGGGRGGLGNGEGNPRLRSGGGGCSGGMAAATAAGLSKRTALRLVDPYDSDGSGEEDNLAVSPEQSAIARAIARATRAVATVDATDVRLAGEAPEAAAKAYSALAGALPLAAVAVAEALPAVAVAAVAAASEAAMGAGASAAPAERGRGAGDGGDAARGLVHKVACLAGEDAAAAVRPLRPGTPPLGGMHSPHSSNLSRGSPGGSGGGSMPPAAQAAAAVSAAAAAAAAEAAADAAAATTPAPANKRARQR